MKKKIISLFLICMLSFTALGGCSGTDREAQESYRQLGIKQLQEGDYSSAEENFQKALDESLGDIGAIEEDICYYKALCQFKNGDIEGAIETYTALIEYDGKNADAYYLRGSAYLAAESGKKCISDYDQAVKLDGNNYDLYVGIYENLKAAGYEDKGRSYLDTALKQECSDAAEYCGQGYIQYLLGEYETADKLLSEAIEKGSDQAVLYQVKVKKALGEEDTAKSLLESYMEAHPEDADALNEAGIMAVNEEEYEEAVKIFEKAIALDEKGENQQLRLNLIYAYEYSGDFEQAYSLMKSYAKEFPNDETVQKELTFLETRASQAQGTDDQTAEDQTSEDQESDD